MKKLIFIPIAIFVIALQMRAQVVVGTLATNVSADAISVDAQGNIYGSDYRGPSGQGNGTLIRKITPRGTVATFATGLNGPAGSVFDPMGNLYVASYNDGKVFKIDVQGSKTLFADLGAAAGPAALVRDSKGNFYAACSGSFTAPISVIKKITSTGQVSDFAVGGTGATFIAPGGLAFDENDNLYISGYFNGNIVKINPAGVLSVLVNLPGVDFNAPIGYMAYQKGMIYAAHLFGNKIFRIALDGTFTILAGTGATGSADGPAATATFDGSNGVAFSPKGDTLYVTEYNGNRVRYITGFPTTTATENITSDKIEITALRNPAQETFDFRMITGQTTDLVISLSDSVGKIITTRNFSRLNAGTHDLSIPVQQLSAGIYICTFKTEGFTKALAIVKQ